MEKEKLNILDIEVKEGPVYFKKGEEIKVPLAPFFSFDKIRAQAELDSMCIGSYGGDNFKNPYFQIVDIFSNIREGVQLIYLCLRILADVVIEERKKFVIWKDGFSLAVFTLSDKGFRGIRGDTSGPAILDVVKRNLPISFSFYFILPDDYYQILSTLSDFAFNKKTDLIITTGGTGVTSRDITPDVTEKIIDKRLWGFEYAIFSEGLKKTKHAIISRAVCGVANKSLIINLPGSEKAVRENLDAVLPAMEHTLKKIHDDPTECGIH